MDGVHKEFHDHVPDDVLASLLKSPSVPILFVNDPRFPGVWFDSMQAVLDTGWRSDDPMFLAAANFFCYNDGALLVQYVPGLRKMTQGVMQNAVLTAWGLNEPGAMEDVETVVNWYEGHVKALVADLKKGTPDAE